MSSELVVVLVNGATREFLDALVGMPSVPRKDDRIHYSEFEPDEAWDFGQGEKTRTVLVSRVTWQVLRNHGWQPVCEVWPLDSGLPPYELPEDL